jgi:hypothetical protein
MKASGFSRAEIAVLINHATDRTASEYYGKRRFGRKRAKKMLGFAPARLLLVRNEARVFKRDPAKRKKDTEQKGAEIERPDTRDTRDMDASVV